MRKASFEPTTEKRAKVRSLAAVGIPQDDVAKIIGCSPKTLRKHFRHELNVASAEATAAVGGFLFQAARSGNVTAMIFWLKTRGRWKVHEASVNDDIDAESARPQAAVVILPHNGRDPLPDFDVTKYLKWRTKMEEKARRRKDRAKAKSLALGVPEQSE